MQVSEEAAEAAVAAIKGSGERWEFEEKECGDLDDVETPRSDTERSLPVSFEEKECGDLDDVQTPRSDTERFN